MNYPNSEQSKAIPFFARFLSVDQDEDPTPDSPPDSEPAPVWTWKWPSDWEDS
ncbi:MAG: microviridin/marinostatin family tricyclic proteinase inhibitor [Microcystis aeruginosa K13-05]|nr:MULTISPECIES: microviridin/marinostatin family tricyclic proteinase inhibitor [Microcystis]AHF21214.1 MdnA [uncultured Microcystis sp.]NCR79652.1 microviridin/marinostatin family tricyclic proteinase inhibitor [Microcystis aeruginosa K13-10]NCR83998.1 microviridin/marinostatin family tricyclic proteinase inhibitor [Microcystis aeruginosa K13-05]MCZ8048655.1 microviridin/marinostatin family tricyclic proteinase inhibitor [Microcystis sp. LE19-41.2A]MCZ8290971.1 microviridin/marinostatin fami